MIQMMPNLWLANMMTTFLFLMFMLMLMSNSKTKNKNWINYSMKKILW